MGLYKLMVNVGTQNVDSIESMDSLANPDTDLTYYFKLECERCGNVTGTRRMSLSDTAVVPKSGGRRSANLVAKCPSCPRTGTISLIPFPSVINLSPSKNGTSVAVTGLEIDGLIPFDFELVGPIWQIKSVGDIEFKNINLEYAWNGQLGELNPEVKVLSTELVRWNPVSTDLV